MSKIRCMRLAVAVVALLLATASVGLAEQLRVVSWNLESGESSPAFLAKQIKGFKQIDLWGFSEVQPSAASTFTKACAKAWPGQTFKSFLGTTGGNDRLLVVYNATRLDLVEQDELLDLRAKTGRAPLSGKFKLKSTGEPFHFMVNHLHRGSPQKRMEQTVGLRAWVTDQTIPSILTGDYNYDVNTKGANKGKGNPAFNKMMEGGVVRWVTHEPFLATHKGSHASVLDFVFLGGSAKSWEAKSEVVVLNDFSIDNDKSSDHRPVLAVLQTPGTKGPLLAKGLAVKPPAAADTALVEKQKKRDEILRRIDQLQRELIDLRQMVRELADD